MNLNLITNDKKLKQNTEKEGVLENALRRLQVIILIRLLIVTILVGSFYIFRIGYSNVVFPDIFPYFIATICFLSIIYAVAIRWLKTFSLFTIFAYAQIVIDIFSEIVFVYLTGGIESWFSFTIFLSIISASIVLNSRASYYMATLSSILYALLIGLQSHNLLFASAKNIFSSKDYIYNAFTYIISFYLIAFLSAYFSKELYFATQSLQEKEADINNLRVLSRDIIESMPSGVFTTDLNWRIITFNRSAEKITGITHSEAMGKTPREIFPFLQNINLKKQWERIEGEVEAKYIGIRFGTLKDSLGEPTGMIGVFQDLTDIKAMESEIQKKEKWAYIGELSALIAHELRNPLASLKASIEMLREKKVSEKHAEHLMEIALSEMDRLNNIITDFLLYAKPQEPDKKPFDLHQSLKDMVTLLLSSETNNKNVSILENLEGKLFINGDSKQLQQVFWNLCINAIDAVSEGGNISISTRKMNNTVEIIFKDTGTGISKEDKEKIFYPFFTTKEKGTGLGLSVAHKIIEAHGGKITVESHGRGTGATFKVVLPVA